MESRQSPITQSVTVTTRGRLHLGFLDLNGELGRRFGSIGLSIKEFRTTLTISTAEQTHVEGPDSTRVEGHIKTCQHFLGDRGGYNVRITEAVPGHIGLGSGTQIALATAAGIRRLHGLPLDIRGDAARLGRGKRSGVGIGLFESGGFVVDGGRGTETVAPVVSRIPFPERWRVLVVLDPSRQGIHGAEERSAFERLPSMPAADAAHLCRLVLMKVLPSVADADFINFGSALTEIQQRVGDYFAPFQGGRFTSPAVAAAVDVLAREGARGIGQSSWGPTGFAFASGDEEATRLLNVVRKHPACQALDIRACEALNHGAEIVAHAAADALHCTGETVRPTR